MATGLMAGKKGLIMGVANQKSIAWNIAERLKEEGAELAFTYQNEQIGEKVVPLFESIGAKFYQTLDVTSDEDFSKVFGQLSDAFGGEIDFIVHAIAGGPAKGDLSGMYLETSRDSFSKALEISVYSFVKAVQLAYPLMREKGGSAVTMSYYGAEKVVPNYNVMGVAKSALESSVRYLAADLGETNIRVNALSPGPVLTRAASGIGDFRNMLKEFAEKTPIKRLVEKEEIASNTLYLLSDLSSGVTGEIIHVDGGYNVKA
ncbi:enoyl-ACP reductase [Orenia metallireducens]|uniref:Enoyl-[acyl-carrier-protein] reductase [NADH] n=1 Tax=Orenia metallireducens TaxID=1413210 RepID=A0A1C0A8W1_9FIRM|nr:enoyl-ACP reductase [Orenia metallireducens]OCL26686.1 enoyl-ACP reductase [Orenia metallireducens]